MDQPASVLDFGRILFGSESPLFLFEIVLRTVIVYIYALALLRWVGSRTIGQLSTVEFLLVIALGSAVGDAMFYPDVPLTHALLVVTIVVLANKGLDILIARSKAAEQVLDGVPEEVIVDGVVCRQFLTDTSLGVSELRQQLRHHGIEHLGQVAHAYVEPDGVLTVFRSKQERPGLPIVPPWEIEPLLPIVAHQILRTPSLLACMRCGYLHETPADSAPGACPHCDHDHWTTARTEAEYRHQ